MHSLITLLTSNKRSWIPGETIPTFVPDSPLASSTPTHSSTATENLIDMFHAFQTGIDVQLSSVVSTLKEVAERITRLESQQSQLEKEVKESSGKWSTSASPLKPGKCRREVPAPLQVLWHLHSLPYGTAFTALWYIYTNAFTEQDKVCPCLF